MEEMSGRQKPPRGKERRESTTKKGKEKIHHQETCNMHQIV